MRLLSRSCSTKAATTVAVERDHEHRQRWIDHVQPKVVEDSHLDGTHDRFVFIEMDPDAEADVCTVADTSGWKRSGSVRAITWRSVGVQRRAPT